MIRTLNGATELLLHEQIARVRTIGIRHQLIYETERRINQFIFFALQTPNGDKPLQCSINKLEYTANDRDENKTSKQMQMYDAISTQLRDGIIHQTVNIE